MDFNAFLTDNGGPIPPAFRAAAAWNRIGQKPSEVVFKNRAGTSLAAQTVRIEYDNRASESQSDAGKAPVRKLTIYGVVNHNLIDDTDIDEGYRFVYEGDEYRVVDTITTLGEIQATCEATG